MIELTDDIDIDRKKKHNIDIVIDRLVINDDKKEVSILDYKTDVDKSTFHDKYVAQIKEYVTLLYGIYPEYKIHAYLLWLNDFSLEEVL